MGSEHEDTETYISYLLGEYLSYQTMVWVAVPSP